MRKLIVLLMLLCLHIAARGQTITSLDDIDLSGLPQPTQAKQLRYWFDDDGSNVRTTTQLSGHHNLDVSALLDGLHTLHFQVVDENGAVATVSSTVFMKMKASETITQAKSLRYWFDDDLSSLTTASATTSTLSLDASHLLDGLHTLHCQVTGNDGSAYDIASGIFIKMGAQSETVTARKLMYWFDDENEVHSIDMTQGVQLLDASHLLDGLHTLHCQVTGNDGSAYDIASGIFIKMGAQSETVTARKLMFWFDDENEVHSIDMTQGVQLLDASHLLDGLHTLHYQVLCSNGQMTPASSSVFLRMNVDTEGTVAKQLRYWFDDAQTATVVTIAQGAILLDASALLDGLHTVHYQIVDSKGSLGSPTSAVFMKMNAIANTVAKRLRYWFDDDTASLKVIDVGKGTQTLDVSALLTGLHTLHYQLIDDEDNVGAPVSRLFIKNFDKIMAEGENRVTKYQYWLNSNSKNMQTVTLSSAENPYQLISLLPMPKAPIRSQLFHFEVADGQPTVYAKNEFHIRFHDAADYFVDDFRTFIDYSVKETLTDIELLESGEWTTTNKPAENAIKWYRLTAEPGDSVQFCLDRTATVQLFSPSGEELLSVSGSESVNWFGCHVREDGTYYLALHDVTATWGNDISINYEHIDKYAVLRQDVAVVGNGGCSTITFEGNGFRDLYAVDLFTEQGDSIHHVYIGHESDATTSVVFDFSDATHGTYHAQFRFTEEDKVFNNLVTVEEAKDIELATIVTYPSTFLRGTSTTFTIKITNRGNMTAYAVPVEIQLLTQSMQAISEIDLSENAPSLDFSWANENEIPIDSIQSLMDYFHSKGDMLHFINAYDSIDGRYFKDAHLAIEIPPLSSYILTVTVKSSESVEIQTLTPSTWNSCVAEFNSDNMARLHRKISKEGMCCVREKVECVMNVIVGILDFASIFPQAKLADCIASLGNTTLQFAYDVWCGEELGGKNKRKAAEDLVWDAINSLVGCLIPGGDKWKMLGNLQWVYQHIYDNISTTMDCVKALTEEIPNCPPDPGGGGGTSTPIASMDPNDIYGYTAESGSHAVKDGLTDVYYRIEFENDTTFATASAHEIYVTDTLDATKFDLSTFAPTRVKIGEKSAELTGDKNFVTTIDMRPSINAIAQVEGTFDEQKGIAKWHISSLDPMTMEPTKYVMDGVLPVNTDGRGIGELSYDISLKPSLAHGTEINNRAGIVFDTNDVIMTPTWTNTIDRIAPESRITNIQVVNDSTAAITITAGDDGSSPWRYDVYVQYGQNAPWWKMAENVPADSIANVKIYEGVDHGFYVVATDMAGNVEVKEAMREFSLTVGTTKLRGDVNCDGAVNIADVAAVLNIMAGNSTGEGDVNGDGAVNIADVAAVINIMAGN